MCFRVLLLLIAKVRCFNSFGVNHRCDLYVSLSLLLYSYQKDVGDKVGSTLIAG